MAFGDLRSGGTFTGSQSSITNPFSITGSCAVSVGDLVFAVLGQQNTLTVTAVSDNLGNTYTATNAGSDNGTITGRAFHSRVTNAGTLTSINATTTASGDDVAFAANVFEGPFLSSPLDANPANVEDITSPFICPATGTLAQADELVVSWASTPGVASVTAWAPASPHIKGAFVGASGAGVLIGYQVVAATTSIAPSYTGGSPPADDVLGTSSFRKDTAPPASTGTLAATDGADASAASGGIAGTGTAAGLEAADTSAASGGIGTPGTLAATEGSDSAALAGSLISSGPLDATEAADAAQASGGIVTTGNIAATDGADDLTAVDATFVEGILAAVDGADGFTAAGAVAAAGELAGTDGADAAEAAGQVISGAEATGSLAAVEGADQALAAGTVVVAGALAATEAADAFAAPSVPIRFPTTGRPGGTQISSRPIGRQNINSRRRNEQAASVRRTG